MAVYFNFTKQIIVHFYLEIIDYEKGKPVQVQQRLFVHDTQVKLTDSYSWTDWV